MKIKRLIAVGALALAMAFSACLVAGCSGQSDEEVIRTAITEELDGIKNLDEETVSMLSEGMDVSQLAEFGIDGTEFMTTYLEGFDYSIDGITVDGDTAEAVVTLTCKSYSGFEQALTDAATDLMSNMSFEDMANMSEEELNTLIGQTTMETLKNVEVAPCEPITIEYTKANNTWTPSDSASNDVAVAMMSN